MNGKQECACMYSCIPHIQHIISRWLGHENISKPILPIRPERCDEVHMSRVVRKPAFCICENKDADQLRGDREADQRLCFRYRDSTIPLLSESEISSL